MSSVLHDYSESLANSYDEIKFDRIQARFDDIQSKILSQTEIAKEANQLISDGSVEKLITGIKEINSIAEAEYENRLFKEWFIEFYKEWY